jgi:superfamily II DNA or RNA helicase
MEGDVGETTASVRLEDLKQGMRVAGLVAGDPVTILTVVQSAPDAFTVYYTRADGDPGHVMALRSHEPRLRVVPQSPGCAFDGDAAAYRLAAEAMRIKMAGQFDPMLAVTTSDLDPLPHQIDAVYGHLLPKMPLRYLLADDPGAGKTIMAGLYIKELLLRGDLARCLIVAPGGLVEQWQTELHEKFRLRFEIFTKDLVTATVPGENLFHEHPYLIARMDQLARSEELLTHLEQAHFDVVVVDEAHRMAAHYFGGELKKTRRYELGELLGRVSEHLLLMTATPHAGKEEDFQLFLGLLDADQFEGRYRKDVHGTYAEGLMLRRLKEELLTFEGKHLFPERFASTVPYTLSEDEGRLYDKVTAYVRDEMNRADQLKQAGEGRRGNTVGFALTVLQRRLASSPEAILKSLERRRARLETRLDETLARSWAIDSRWSDVVADYDSAEDTLEELGSNEREVFEEEVIDAATAARTAEELRHEINVLDDLVREARRVRFSGTDVKWTQLRELLTESPEMFGDDRHRHKIIIFTEHRDTLNYLAAKIRDLLGRSDAVATIHGGISREERLRIQDAFRQDPELTVLVATDAAGEGLNLQRAHLMINYDLPWNPNRIEQRFGRIHRIGQTQPCHLWNLVADGTREGDVFRRLLDKIDQMRATYKGKVFDVLGQVFDDAPLSKLLVEAIRYGDLPETKARLNQIIDAKVSEGLPELIKDQALHKQLLSLADIERVRRQMEEARARRLQPHHIEGFFRGALTTLRGRIAHRQPGRFEVTHVPQAIRERRQPGGAVLHRYERVCFDRRYIEGEPKADLLAPGHPLLDAVVDAVIERYGPVLESGTILIDRLDVFEEPRLLVAVRQDVVDGHEPPRPVLKRFKYVELYPDGRHRENAVDAPFLDYDAPAVEELELVAPVLGQGWLSSAPQTALAWAAGTELPKQVDELQERVSADIARTRRMVETRLTQEINYQYMRQAEVLEQLREGKRVKQRPEAIERRIAELEERLKKRLAGLEREERLHPLPPKVASLALVIPQGMLDRLSGKRGKPIDHYTRETKLVEMRAVRAVIEAERALGRDPHVQAHNNPGFDIKSYAPAGFTVFIEVKGRIDGSEDFKVTRTEVVLGKNADHYRLALVTVSTDGPDADKISYVTDPFDGLDIAEDFALHSVVLDWRAFWRLGGPPH